MYCILSTIKSCDAEWQSSKNSPTKFSRLRMFSEFQIPRTSPSLFWVYPGSVKGSKIYFLQGKWNFGIQYQGFSKPTFATVQVIIFSIQLLIINSWIKVLLKGVELWQWFCTCNFHQKPICHNSFYVFYNWRQAWYNTSYF